MNWFQLAAGENCPFDPPRIEPNDSWDPVAKLRVSTACLLKNQAYRGHCIVIYDLRHAARPDELTSEEWGAYSEDLHRVVRAVTSVCHPDHINVESLGNQMPHLHWHVIPRYRSDPRWGAAIWTTSAEELHQAEMAEEERRRLLGELRARLEAADDAG